MQAGVKCIWNGLCVCREGGWSVMDEGRGRGNTADLQRTSAWLRLAISCCRADILKERAQVVCLRRNKAAPPPGQSFPVR